MRLHNLTRRGFFRTTAAAGAAAAAVQVLAGCSHPAEETVPESGNSITYGTQVLVTSKVLPSSDPFFKGNPFKKYPAGKYYKYVIGFSDDLSTASTAFEKLKKSFPDSFLVKIENGEFSRIK